MAENVPQMIGKYRIMGLVAKGGMGAVYKAVHPTLKRMVILKKLTIKGTPRFGSGSSVRLRFCSTCRARTSCIFLIISSKETAII